MIGSPYAYVFAAGPVVAVDLNDGKLGVRRLDEHGNPVGKPARIDVNRSGTSARRDAQVRHAITGLIHYTLRHGVGTIAVEDLDFADARAIGRETMGRGRRGKRFRKTVAGIPTAVFGTGLPHRPQRPESSCTRSTPPTPTHGATSTGASPTQTSPDTRAAATVIGRRAQGHKARRRDGVTRTRPEDHVVRATNQATPHSQRVTSSRHQPGTPGTKSRPPGRTRMRLPGRATVTPATANNGQQHQ